jgi:IclR family acetate operon transcriptional repressor
MIEKPSGHQEHPISAIHKVAAIVEALVSEHRLTRIAARTGLPISTVHRVLQELVILGWARQGPDRDYALGPRLLSLAGQAGKEAAVLRVARPVLQRLRDRTGHTIHLGLRDHDQAIYVEKLEGERAYQMRSRVGLTIPLHSTAIGKAILAALPEEEVRGIAARTGLAPCTRRTITDLSILLEHLRRVREVGYAVDYEENEEHTRCIGAAIFDHRGVAIGAVSLSSLAFDLDASQIRAYAPLVVAAAREISRALGASAWNDGASAL